jgi:hypothetical protein
LRVQQSGVKEEERPVKVWNAAGAEIAPATKGTPFFGRRLALPERPEERQVPASATRFQPGRRRAISRQHGWILPGWKSI